MTALALELPFVDDQLRQDRPGRTPFRGREAGRAGGGTVFGGGEATLADAIAGAWEDLTAARAVACPVCTGELAPHVVTAAGDLIAARCTDCGAELD